MSERVTMLKDGKFILCPVFIEKNKDSKILEWAQMRITSLNESIGGE